MRSAARRASAATSPSAPCRPERSGRPPHRLHSRGRRAGLANPVDLVGCQLHNRCMAATGITVAIDGPAGAGKSTVAMRVAAQLGYTLVDTGAIYRAVALLARRADVAWDDDERLLRDRPRLAGVKLPARGRHSTVSSLTARRSRRRFARPTFPWGPPPYQPGRRCAPDCVDLQRRLAGQGGAVLEGRDIGTVVCPQAPVKIFLDASPAERARRRFEELRGKGEQATSMRCSTISSAATGRARAEPSPRCEPRLTPSCSTRPASTSRR